MMIVSSRTPEGEPQRCPICSKTARLEPCDPGGDLICPSCGSLFRRVCSLIAQQSGRSRNSIRLRTSLRDQDSLDMVELIMDLEAEYDVRIPDEIAERLRTVEDAIRYIISASQRRKGEL